MKKVIVEKSAKLEIELANVGIEKPIFAKLEGKLSGMVVREDKGWSLRLGGEVCSCGWHAGREKCLLASQRFGYEFFVED